MKKRRVVILLKQSFEEENHQAQFFLSGQNATVVWPMERTPDENCRWTETGIA